VLEKKTVRIAGAVNPWFFLGGLSYCEAGCLDAARFGTVKSAEIANASSRTATMSIIAGEPPPPVRLDLAGRDFEDDREGNDAAYNPTRLMVAALSTLVLRTAESRH
jgi:hypothetical protein